MTLPTPGAEATIEQHRSPWLRDALACLLILLASIAVVAVHVPKHATVSPIDEYVYIDYYAKVLDQGVVHRGEETGEYAREYLACHGVRAIGVYPDPLCRSEGVGRDTAYPNAGVTSADLYTPLYFAVTRVLAQPLVWFGVELTDAGRYIGGLWLGAGAILLYLAIVRLRISRLVAAGISILMIGSLSAYWSNTYISTDATALLSGALMLFLAVPLAKGPTWRGVVGLSLAAAVISALKLQNLLAVGIVALWLLAVAFVAAWGETGTPTARLRSWVRDRRSIAALCAIAAGLLVQGVWIVVRSALAVGPQPDQGVSAPFTKEALFLELFKFFPGVADGALQPASVGPEGPAAAAVLTCIIAAGVIGLAVKARAGSNDELLALTVLIVSVVAGPILAIANVLVGGFYFVLVARYGTALIPAMLICAALLFRSDKRWVAPLTLVVGVGAFLLSLAFTEG